MSKTVPFQTIHFSINTQFSFIWPIDRSLSGATTPGQSGPGNNGNETGIPHFPNLQHYWNFTIRWFHVISRTRVGRGLALCRDADGVFYSHSRQGKISIMLYLDDRVSSSDFQILKSFSSAFGNCSLHTR